MHFPVMGLLGAVASALGLYTIFWYENLTPEQKAEADELAQKYARELYGKGLKALTTSQFQYVQKLVKGELAA